MNVFENSHEIGVSNNNLSIMSRSIDEAGPSGFKGIGNSSDFSRIEELIRGSTFSREDVSRLVQILNSRVEVESEKNKLCYNAGADAQQVNLMHEIPRTPTAEKRQDLERTMAGGFLEKADVCALSVTVGVGASPVDIARAFMAGCCSERGHDLYNYTSKNTRTQISNDFSQKTFIESPSSKSPICWPGARVHDRRGYATPQSQRGRYGIRDFPRTPYSRTNLSKSTTKLQAESSFANTPTPFQQSQTPIFGQVRSRGEAVDGDRTVGPIRRIRNKFATEVRPRGSIFMNSPKEVPSSMVKPNDFRDFLPSTEKNLEPGETSGALKNLSADNVSNDPNSTSSQAVRKILEHLDRTKPNPKEKESELKMATMWRNSSISNTGSSREENISSLNFGEPSSHKSTDIAAPSLPEKIIETGNNSNYLEKSSNAGNDNAEASSLFFADSSRIPVTNAMPAFGLTRNSDPVVNNLHGDTFHSTNDGSKETPSRFAPHLSNGQEIKSVPDSARPETSKNHTTKPSLPPIFTTKPYARAVPSETGPGFTFPVSSSSRFFIEPPTPSIMPSSSVSNLAAPTVPSFDFGTNKSTPHLVFSFPSSSNVAAAPEASDIKFNFGSQKKTRLAFSSIGKDALCF